MLMSVFNVKTLTKKTNIKILC